MELEYYGHQSNMGMKNDHNKLDEFEGTFEDDDAFYEEIRRQILILTADEDEDEDFLGKTKNNVPCIRGNSKRLTGRFTSTIQPGGRYFSWWESENANSEIVPTWLVNLWKNGSGTGVFIPQIVKSRRRYRPGRKNNEKSRTYRQAAARTGGHKHNVYGEA